MHTMAVKKLRFWFCALFVFKRQTSYVKGYHLSIEGVLKGYLLCQNCYMKGKELDLWVEPSPTKLC